MGIIDGISTLYDGNIQFFPPFEGKLAGVPDELADLLRQSDGVMETMVHPRSGEVIPVGWVIYPGAMMAEETVFYRETYGVEGTAFATDGAGSPYLLKRGGQVVHFDPIDGEEVFAAGSLVKFFRCS